MPTTILDLKKVQKCVFHRLDNVSPSGWVSYSFGDDPVDLYDYLIFVTRGAAPVAKHLVLTVSLSAFRYMLFANLKITRDARRLIIFCNPNSSFAL